MNRNRTRGHHIGEEDVKTERKKISSITTDWGKIYVE
jgi:hypothetical protein